MYLQTSLSLLVTAVLATSVTAQSINGTATGGGTNNGTNSGQIGLTIIANSTTDPALKKAIEILINATVNGTAAFQKIVSDAAKQFINNGNVTYAAIAKFVDALEKNITTLGNATLTAAISRVNEFVQRNQQAIQRTIDRLRTELENLNHIFWTAINSTAGAFFGFLTRPLPSLPPLPTLPTLPPFSFNGSAGISVG